MENNEFKTDVKEWLTKKIYKRFNDRMSEVSPLWASLKRLPKQLVSIGIELIKVLQEAEPQEWVNKIKPLVIWIIIHTMLYNTSPHKWSM